MKSFGRIARVLALGPLLAACSLGTDPAPPNAVIPTPTTRPVTIQNNLNLSGRLLFIQGGNLYMHQGTVTRQITSDGETRDPAWAPDGSRIAYVRREESYSDIYLVNATGGLPTQVTFNSGASEPWSQSFMHEVVWATNPAWTPDSQRLVFLSQLSPPTTEGDNPSLYEFPLAIYSYATDLIGQRQPTNDDLLVRADDADLQRPVWSPDGSLLAYVQVPRGNGVKQIMLYDPANGSTTPFPGIPENAYDPAWSPDGNWLAFAATVDGQTDVWAVPNPRVGGSAVRITSSGSNRAPEWSPDGSQLAFIRVGTDGADVFVVPLQQDNGGLSGGEAQQLTSDGQVDANSGLSWGP